MLIGVAVESNGERSEMKKRNGISITWSLERASIILFSQYKTKKCSSLINLVMLMGTFNNKVSKICKEDKFVICQEQRQVNE